MSKEAIELLKQVAYELDAYITGGYFPNTHVLLDKVENFLAQPEQTTQEPTAWKDRTYGNLHHTNWGDSIPLYASPPTHKPLSDDDTVAMFKDNKLATHPDSYWAGIDDAEKAHGIAEGGE